MAFCLDFTNEKQTPAVWTQVNGEMEGFLGRSQGPSAQVLRPFVRHLSISHSDVNMKP